MAPNLSRAIRCARDGPIDEAGPAAATAVGRSMRERLSVQAGNGLLTTSEEKPFDPLIVVDVRVLAKHIVGYP